MAPLRHGLVTPNFSEVEYCALPKVRELGKVGYNKVKLGKVR